MSVIAQKIDLPNSWELVPLGEFVMNEKGKKPKKESKEKTSDYSIPYIDIAAFEEGIIKSWTNGEGCRLCYEDDFLMVWDGSRSGLVGKGISGALGSTLVRINFPGILNDYAFYFLRSKFAEINSRAKGVGIPHVDPNLLWNYGFPIPPTNEQKRIVAKIDELQSKLDNAIQCMVVSEQKQKVFYQAVLDSAFLQCTEERKLGELLSKKLSNGYSGKPVPYTTNYKVLGLSSTTTGTFIDAHYKFLDEKNLESRDIWCEPNDILIQRGNTIEYVGVPAIYNGKPNTFIFPDLMIRARADENIISTKFLYYALSSPKIRNYLRKNAKGSAGTMPKINQETLTSTPIPFCSPTKQRAIVDAIEEQLSNGAAIECVIRDSLAKAHVLRQSILKKAFSGQLVAQDPADEPASVLLERIRAEKEGQTAKKSPKEKRRAA